MGSIFARIFENPKTTTLSLAPFIIAIAAKIGLNLDEGLVSQGLAGVYAIILLFLKDFKKID